MNIEKLGETRGTILSRLELMNDLISVPQGFYKKYKLNFEINGKETFIGLSFKHKFSFVVDEGFYHEHKNLNVIPSHCRHMALQHAIQLIKDLNQWIEEEIQYNTNAVIDADKYIASLKKEN